MSTATQPTITEELNDVYHADRSHVSASMLKVLAESPQAYYQRFVTGTLQQEETDALRFGRAFHAIALEPETFAERFVVAPKCDRRTKEGKAVWAEFQDSLNGAEVIDADWMPQLEAMRAALMAHDDASELLEAEGKVEHVIRWEDRIFRKARPDKIVPCQNVILDLKTVSEVDERSFYNSVARFRWHLQAAYYTQAVEGIYGEEYRVVFAAIGKQPPHEVCLYQLREDDMEQSERKVEELVSELILRRETGDWLAGRQKGINDGPLPKWVWSDFWNAEE